MHAAQLAAPRDRGRQGASAHEVHGPVPQQAVVAAAEDLHHGLAGRGQVHRQLAQESARGSSSQRVLVPVGGAVSEGTVPMVGFSAAERVWRYCKERGSCLIGAPCVSVVVAGAEKLDQVGAPCRWGKPAGPRMFGACAVQARGCAAKHVNHDRKKCCIFQHFSSSIRFPSGRL